MALSGSLSLYIFNVESIAISSLVVRCLVPIVFLRFGRGSIESSGQSVDGSLTNGYALFEFLACIDLVSFIFFSVSRFLFF